jgi:DNA invertase Pin-like site-specific DNA recombinase
VDRPGWAAMLEYCREHGIRTILIENMSRLCREPIVGEILLMKCRKEGFAVIDCSTGMDLAKDSEDPMVRCLQRVMMAFFALEKDLIVHRTTKAKRRISERTGKCEGQKSYREMPEHAAAVARIDELDERRIPSRTIANTLNAEGFSTKYGKPWSHGVVCGVINQRREG